MDKHKRRNLWLFPLGTVGRDMMYTLFNSYLLTYVLFTRSLTAAQLSAITVIMVAARMFDALNDPIMGNIIEHTRTRFGKFKPWLVIGITLSCLVIWAAFNSTLQGWAFIAFFGLIYFCYSIAYTMHDISYWGMIAALSSDADTRNQLTSRATLFGGIGGTIASMIIPMFTTGGLALGGSAATAYGRIALLFCVIGPVLLCATIFGVRERREESDKPAPPISLKKVVSTITGNDQLLYIAIIFLIQQIGNNITISGIGSTYIYFGFGYRGGLYSLFNTVGVLATAVLMVFYPTISRRMPRKRLMRVTMSISCVGYAVMLLTGFLLPKELGRFWGVTLGYTAANFGQYSFYLIMMISIINTVEYNEYLHGERDEAIITSLRPFLTKMAAALVIALTSLTYILCGVTGTTNQISELENAAAKGLLTEVEKLAAIDNVIASVSAGQTNSLFLCMTLLPFALMIISYVLYQRKYTLDEAEYTRICAELEARKGGRA